MKTATLVRIFAGLFPFQAEQRSAKGLLRTQSYFPPFLNPRERGRPRRHPDRYVRPRLRRSESDQKRFMSTLHPVGRIGRPDKVAGAVVWLASDEVSFVTGQILAVDGGFTAQ